MTDDYIKVIERLDEIADCVLRLEANMIDLQAQLDTLVPRSRRSASVGNEASFATIQAALAHYLTMAQPVGYDNFATGVPLLGAPNGAEYGYYIRLTHACPWLAQRYPRLTFGPQYVRHYLMLHQWHQTRLVMRDTHGRPHRLRYWYHAETKKSLTA
jgi:hypothetical protein